jgi:hypothetical protein
VHCLGSVFAEDARLGELLSKRNDQRLHAPSGTIVGADASSGLVSPVDAVQPPPGSVPNPPLNYRQTDAKFACRFAHSNAGANSFHHSPAPLLDTSGRSTSALFFARTLNSLFFEYHPFGYLSQRSTLSRKTTLWDRRPPPN